MFDPAETMPQELIAGGQYGRLWSFVRRSTEPVRMTSSSVLYGVSGKHTNAASCLSASGLHV